MIYLLVSSFIGIPEQTQVSSYCWILCDKIYLRIFLSMLMGGYGPLISVLVISLSDFGTRLMKSS